MAIPYAGRHKLFKRFLKLLRCIFTVAERKQSGAVISFGNTNETQRSETERNETKSDKTKQNDFFPKRNVTKKNEKFNMT
jgi:hypothetical protein